MITWSLSKQNFGDLKISFSLVFMPSDQIVNMSLNELRRKVATRHKNLNGPLMDETLFALDS
jgi:hypothetical protein